MVGTEGVNRGLDEMRAMAACRFAESARRMDTSAALLASFVQEALSEAGAARVEIYLWDPTGHYLYNAAGGTSAGRDETEAFGLPLGAGAGYLFFKGSDAREGSKAKLQWFANQAGQLLMEHGGVQQHWTRGSEEVVVSLIQALRVKSPLTAGHCRRVSQYTSNLARALDFAESRIVLMEQSGLLHDIGKIGISGEVLEKPGALSPDEWTLIKKHPEIGVEVIQPSASLASTLPAVAMHHERFDGRGYPYGLSGLDIPLEARIVSVCDAYDTMTSDRPYRKAVEPEEALARLQESAGSQFDPLLVQAFARQVFPDLNRSGKQGSSTANPSS